MRFTSSLIGGVLLLTFTTAKPVKKRELGYGDRSEYLKDYQQNRYASLDPNTPIYPSPTPGPDGQPPWPQTGPDSNPVNNGGNSDSSPIVVSDSFPQSSPSPVAFPNDGRDNNLRPAGSFPGAGTEGQDGVTFPLNNGFPDIQNPSEALNEINQAAHGSLSNAQPPAKLPGPETLTSLQLIAFNELFEVFFFTELLNRIVSNAPGFEFQDQALKQQVVTALTAVQAQEQLHALNANTALKRAGLDPIKPCTYIFPAITFKEAIILATTFTDIVLGTLADVSVIAGSTGDPNLIRGFTASLGQEGEQNGFYRSLLGKIPSALPFLTASTRQFAFSALNQNFVVPNSCPNANTIPLPIFGKLALLSRDPKPEDQTLVFRMTPLPNQEANPQGMSIVYINQQLVPIVLPLEGLSQREPGGPVDVRAFFPYKEFLMNGLTMALLVEGAGPLPNVTAVAAATRFGPALIEIN